MGQQVILDIAGSFVIGGILFLTILTFSTRNYETKVKIRDEGATIREIKNTVEIIEEDFRRIGYCALPSLVTRPVITYADSNRISFKSDVLTSPGSVGTLSPKIVDYRIEGKNTAVVNPKAKRLVKRIDNQTVAVFSVTRFRLRYYNANGQEMTSFPITQDTSLSKILFIGLELEIENDYPLRSQDNLNTFVTAVSSWKHLYISIQNFGVNKN